VLEFASYYHIVSPPPDDNSLFGHILGGNLTTPQAVLIKRAFPGYINKVMALYQTSQIVQ
jgi:hypothetical protein